MLRVVVFVKNSEYRNMRLAKLIRKKFGNLN